MCSFTIFIVYYYQFASLTGLRFFHDSGTRQNHSSFKRSNTFASLGDVKFKTFGCGAAVATSSMATELVKGKNIQEAMQITNKAVMEALDGLPPVKVHCSLLAEEAIHAALWDYAEKNDIKIEGLEKPKSDIHEGEEEEEEEY